MRKIIIKSNYLIVKNQTVTAPAFFFFYIHIFPCPTRASSAFKVTYFFILPVKLARYSLKGCVALRLAIGNQRLPGWVRSLVMCRGELFLVISRIIFKCLWRRWKCYRKVKQMASLFPSVLWIMNIRQIKPRQKIILYYTCIYIYIYIYIYI